MKKLYKILMFIPLFGPIIAFIIYYFKERNQNSFSNRNFFEHIIYAALTAFAAILLITLATYLANLQDYVLIRLIIDYFVVWIILDIFFLDLFKDKKESAIEEETKNEYNKPQEKPLKKIVFFKGGPLFYILLFFVIFMSWMSSYVLVLIYPDNKTTFLICLVTLALIIIVCVLLLFTVPFISGKVVVDENGITWLFYGKAKYTVSWKNINNIQKGHIMNLPILIINKDENSKTYFLLTKHRLNQLVSMCEDSTVKDKINSIKI